MIKIKFGDKKNVFSFLDEDNISGKVSLCGGFAEEWEDYVDYDKSCAYIIDGILYVEIYGIPDYFKEEEIVKFYKEEFDHWTENGEVYEMFEIENYYPINIKIN